MKKLNLFWLAALALLTVACESELEKELAAALESDAIASVVAQTRDGSGIAILTLHPGDRVGIIAECENERRGPLPFTLNSSMTGLIESLPVINAAAEHTLYAYSPYGMNQSGDPAKIEVTPVQAVQTQYGNGDLSALDNSFYVSQPVRYNAGDDPTIEFSLANIDFCFEINANTSGVVVKSIEVKAPNGKIINFTSGYIDCTKQSNDPAFRTIYGIAGGTSKTTLNIESGGLSIPNSTTDNALAYMSACPFNCAGETLTVTVTTSDNETYTYSIAGRNYLVGETYDISIRIEKTKKPVVKNIRVLSLCDVGCLGLYDNTKQWNCNYGAIDVHAKEIRRMLFEYFGKGKFIETGVISFDKTDVKCMLNKMKDCDLDKYNIIYLNKNGHPDAALVKRIMSWLSRSEDRVLMLSYDWKDPCVKPTMADNTILCYAATNYLMFKHAIKDITPHWYNCCTVNKSIGNYGATRSNILVPVELNERTKYFWKDGPFKTTLTASSDQRYWVEDIYWGSAVVNSPNVIPLITYRDAKNGSTPTAAHKSGSGDNGMILGVDPTTRIVYIGDSEIFSTECVLAKQQDARMAKRDGCKADAGLNNYSKIMGNLWAWMINEVIQKP